jgi:hypothetical protein
MQLGAARAWIFGVAATITLAASPALADEPVTPQRCNAAYERAQVMRRDRKLTAARESLLVCSQPKCPAAITADCGPWLREVETTMPSVVFVTRDASGRDVPAVKVSVEGVVLATRLGGSAIEVDPGERTFVFEPEHGKRVELKLVINTGEKNRLVPVTIIEGAAAPAPATSSTASTASTTEPIVPASGERGSLVPAIVVGGLGLASLGASLGVYLDAKSGTDKLRDTCAPDCPKADVDSLRTKGIISDVTFGVGLAGLGVAGLMIVLRAPAKAPTPSATGLVQWTVAPTTGGAAAGLTGRF